MLDAVPVRATAPSWRRALDALVWAALALLLLLFVVPAWNWTLRWVNGWDGDNFWAAFWFHDEFKVPLAYVAAGSLWLLLSRLARWGERPGRCHLKWAVLPRLSPMASLLWVALLTWPAPGDDPFDPDQRMGRIVFLAIPAALSLAGVVSAWWVPGIDARRWFRGFASEVLVAYFAQIAFNSPLGFFGLIWFYGFVWIVLLAIGLGIVGGVSPRSRPEAT